MVFFLSILLLISYSILISSILRIKGRTAFLLSIYLISFSSIVFIAQLSGIMGLLSNRLFFLFAQVVLLCIALFVWVKFGRPFLFTPFTGFSFRSEVKKITESIKQNPLPYLFALIVGAGYLGLAWLIIRVPPNNCDSMHTHLARVAYWLQQSSFAQLTNFSVFAKIYPFDANLNLLYTILFTGSDRFVGFVQFFAAIFSSIAIFGIARLLGGSNRAAIILSLLWMTFPQNVFQATSTQNDLVVTSLFTTCIYFFFAFIKQRNKSSLILSGLALGLSFGTKETVFMMGPGIVIMLLILIIQDKHFIKPISEWLLISIVSFFLLGSYPYFNNLYHYNNPLGPTEHVLGDSFGSYSLQEKFKFNAPRLIFQFISFDSLPVQIAEQGVVLRERAFTKLTNILSLPLESQSGLKDVNKTFTYNLAPSWNEDESWFGLVSTLLIPPAIFLGIYFGIKKKDLLSLVLVIFGITFFIFEIILRPGWDPYQGRYFVLSIALTVPLSIHILNESLLSRIFTLLICAIACLVFFMAVFSNHSKPILGKKSFELKYQEIEYSYLPQNDYESVYKEIAQIFLYKFWENLPFQKSLANYDDIQLRALCSLKQHEKILRIVNRDVPPKSNLGVILGGGAFDYIFFGPNLERKITPINPISFLSNEDWVIEKEISYVLIYNPSRVDHIPKFLDLIYKTEYWVLYHVDI